MDANNERWVSALPWVLAVAGLAVPMIGSGFIGWPFVVGWLFLLLLLRWIRPLADADSASRIVGGIGALLSLALLSTIGGFYLMPAVIVSGWCWLHGVTARSHGPPADIGGAPRKRLVIFAHAD
jgi:hypothetical protein